MSWVVSLPIIRLATLIVCVCVCVCVCMHVSICTCVCVCVSHKHRILPFTKSPLNIVKSASMVGSRWLPRNEVGFQVSSA